MSLSIRSWTQLKPREPVDKHMFIPRPILLCNQFFDQSCHRIWFSPKTDSYKQTFLTKRQ